MSLWQTIFGGPSGQPAQPAPGNTNVQPNNTPGTQDNGVVPPNGQGNDKQQTQDDANKSPLDKHADIWKIDPNANSAPAPIFAGLDPAKVMESAKKVDFSKAVTPEQLTAISKGGEEAVVAFSQALNSVAQNVYAQSAVATAQIVEKALEKSQKSYDERLPSTLKRLSANDGLLQSNPVFANPALQPLVGALTEQLTRKNPNATQLEIQQQVSDYFESVGATFAPKPKEETSKSGKSREQDWSTFLD